FFSGASGCATPEVIDQTTRTSSICELHHVQMARARVRFIPAASLRRIMTILDVLMPSGLLIPGALDSLWVRMVTFGFVQFVSECVSGDACFDHIRPNQALEPTASRSDV